MEGTSRMQMVHGHLLGHLHFDHDPSLDAYRQRGLKFDQNAFYDFYYQVGLKYYKQYREVFRGFKTLSHDNTTGLTKSEVRQLALKQLTEVLTGLRIDRVTHLNNSLLGFIMGKVLFYFDMSMCVRLGVHFTLYVDSLNSLGTQKHIALLDRAYAGLDIGCFGMTELGHGSNVSSIGTTATYIHSTREFEINTPDSLSAKWWIGGAFETAKMCTVFAQLLVNGKNKGIHAFVVQLRDADTYKVRPGIIIGDCGDKFENNAIDNGFIIFKKLRVPYDALLDSISSIDKDGHFHSTIEKKEKRFGRMLSPLIRGRTSVTQGSEANLKHALTIAVRWAAVRKQFGPPNCPEVPILDYQLTRNRLTPHLSNLFATTSALEIMFLNYDRVKSQISANPECVEGVEFHAVLSALKVLTSEWAFAGIHESRKVCGGIGYSSYSRLGQLLAKHDVNLTWEGDNNVLLQQTAAFIIKQIQKMFQGKKVEVESLKAVNLDSTVVNSLKAPENLTEISNLVIALEQLFNVLTLKALLRLQENSTASSNLFEAWGSSQPSLQSFGKVFGIVILSKYMISRIQALRGQNEELFGLFYKIVQLFMVDKLVLFSAELLATGYLSAKQFEMLEKKLNELCWQLGENLVNIIDAIADDDFMHGSAIGCKDGQAYTRLARAVEGQKDCYQEAPRVDIVQSLMNS